MSKQAVTLRVPIHEDWDAGDRLQIYTNFGSGEVDTDKPLLRRPVEIFPGQQRSRGLGRQPVGIGRVGDFKAARPRRGLGTTRAGVTPVGTTPAVIEVTVDLPAAFGKWKFAAKAIDRHGNVQSGDLEVIEAVVSGTEPPPLEAFSYNGYDSETDQVSFDFSKGAE